MLSSSASLRRGTGTLAGAARREPGGAAISIATPTPTRGATTTKVSAALAPRAPAAAAAAAAAVSSPLSPRLGASAAAARAHPVVGALPEQREEGSSSQKQQKETRSLTLLWLKHDLRLDDHLGIAAALSSSSSHLLPLYVLDGAALPETCPGPCGAAALVGALESLRASLRVRGSDLIVLRCAEGETAADAVTRAAKRMKASRVIAESEVSPQWRHELKQVQKKLLEGEKDDEEQRKMELLEWSASLHARPAKDDGEGEGEVEAEGDWRKHVRARGPLLPPLAAPGALPPLPQGVAEALGIQGAGRIPSAQEVVEIVAAAAAASNSSSSGSSSYFNGSVLPYGSPQSSNDVAASRVYSGGEATARAALAAYVAGGTLSTSTSAGPAAPSAATEELAKVIAAAAAEADVPGAEGSSFAALFAPSLALGTLSPRRVAADAASALSCLPLFPAISVPKASARARAARASAEASDFHRSLALSRADRAAKGGGELRYWRWRGVLTEFVLVNPQDENGKPIPSLGDILLVHGFGAFGEHYRDASAALAKMGYTVWAPTLPGYGRSEKPAARYGQGLWGSFISDFAACVVKGPVVAAGNSIGGYIVAAAAASSGAELFKGVVLLNPAGRVDGIATGQETGGGGAPGQKQQAEEESSRPPSRLFVEAVSRALFLYLELSIAKTLKRLYPSNPDAADDWLAAEIGRAAKDPGALAVFQSVFYMPKPRALDVLLVKEFGGPCLLLQGAKDPLNDARGRARALGDAVPGIEVKLLDAGHCPHDEIPKDVAEEIAAFAARCFSGNDESSEKRKNGAGGGGAGSLSSSSSNSSSSAASGSVVSRTAALV